MQDAHGLNVTLVLWCVWASVRFAEPDPATLKSAVTIADEWERTVVSPLRGVRRRLKASPDCPPIGAIEELRDQVKAAELGAERIMHDRLDALAVSALSPAAGGAPDRRARKTLAAYARQAGAARTAGFSIALLEKVIGLTVGGATHVPPDALRGGLN